MAVSHYLEGDLALSIARGLVVNTTSQHKFGAVPIPIPAKSDIDVRASVRSNNARITAAFDLILVRN